MYYKRVFLHYVLAKIETCNSASEVAKSVNLLMAIYWIAHAWREVKADTIVKCFKTAGTLTTALDVVSTCVSTIDPFGDVDVRMELGELIRKTVGDESCPATEYVDGDADFPVCAEFVAETWEEDFLKSLTKPDDENCHESDKDMDILPPPPKLASFIQVLEDVKHFLEDRKYSTEAQNKMP